MPDFKVRVKRTRVDYADMTISEVADEDTASKMAVDACEKGEGNLTNPIQWGDQEEIDYEAEECEEE